MDPHLTAFQFPGQGSQAVGMGRALAGAYPTARETFEQADDLLGLSLSRLCWEGPEADLNSTINTQPALLAHSVAVLRVFQELHPGFRPACVAGHSMGELSALVASGALPFEAALRLARRRGELMMQAGEVSPGGMAAILGMDIPALDALCAAASRPGEPVQVANDNCPGQVVISGARPALERALELAAAQVGAKRVKPLAVSIAAHSPLMAQAQAGFNMAVAEAGLADPHTPLVGNVIAAPLHTAAEIHADLTAQLTSRVRWTESIQAMRAGVTTFLELGSGAVLTGLLKRIDKEATGIVLGEPADFEKLKDW